MTFQELMMKSLTNLLEEEEILKYPIYATLMQRGKHWFGYFGLTDRYLLIALLEGSSQIISWTSRVPLDIKEVKVKKSFIPAQYKVRVEFNEGDPCNIRVSKKVVGFDMQEENLDGFITYLEQKRISKGGI